jgi:hypothetical protein
MKWVMLSPTGLSTDEDGRGPDKARGAPEDLVPQVKTAEEGGGRDGKAGHLSLTIKGRCQFQEQETGDLILRCWRRSYAPMDSASQSGECFALTWFLIIALKPMYC